MQILLQVLNTEPKAEGVAPGIKVDGETPDGDSLFAALFAPQETEGSVAVLLPIDPQLSEAAPFSMQELALIKTSVEVTEGDHSEPPLAVDPVLPKVAGPTGDVPDAEAVGMPLKESEVRVPLPPKTLAAVPEPTLATTARKVDAPADRPAPQIPVQVRDDIKPSPEKTEIMTVLSPLKQPAGKEKAMPGVPPTAASAVSAVERVARVPRAAPELAKDLPEPALERASMPGPPGHLVAKARLESNVPPPFGVKDSVTIPAVNKVPQNPLPTRLPGVSAQPENDAPPMRNTPAEFVDRTMPMPPRMSSVSEPTITPGAPRERTARPTPDVSITVAPAKMETAVPIEIVPPKDLAVFGQFTKDGQTGRDVPVVPDEGLPPLTSAEPSEMRRRSDPGPHRLEPPARPVLTQLVQAAKSAIDGMVEVKLSPEELGRVRLAMTPAESGMTVLVTAERPETLDLIRRNIDLFAADLTEQGFTDLSFAFGGETAGERTDRPEGGPETSVMSEQQSVFDGAVARANITPDGRVDLRL